MFPSALISAINAKVSPEVTHLGVVLSDLAGRYLVSRPPAHPSGVTSTFPRIHVQEGELPADTLFRCLAERVGIKAESAYLLPQFQTSAQSTTVYVAGMIFSDCSKCPDPAPAFVWCSPEEAAAGFELSPDASSRHRDLSVLAAVSTISPSPYRRIFLMVRELHRMGFQRLRIVPAMSPSGCYWRCSIVPAGSISRDHGARMDGDAHGRFDAIFGTDFGQWTYFSGQEQEPFDWTDAHFDSPRELAEKFVQRLREIACGGWGADRDYARWYEAMLTATVPNGLLNAYTDYEMPGDGLPSLMTTFSVKVPFPPRVGGGSA